MWTRHTPLRCHSWRAANTCKVNRGEKHIAIQVTQNHPPENQARQHYNGWEQQGQLLKVFCLSKHDTGTEMTASGMAKYTSSKPGLPAVLSITLCPGENSTGRWGVVWNTAPTGASHQQWSVFFIDYSSHPGFSFDAKEVLWLLCHHC